MIKFKMEFEWHTWYLRNICLSTWPWDVVGMIFCCAIMLTYTVYVDTFSSSVTHARLPSSDSITGALQGQSPSVIMKDRYDLISAYNHKYSYITLCKAALK